MPTTVLVMAEDGKMYTEEVKTIDDLYELLPIKKRHRHSLNADDYDRELGTSGIFMLYESKVYAKTQEYNLKAAKLLLDYNLLELPIVPPGSALNAYFVTLPVGNVVFYRLKNKELIECKELPSDLNLQVSTQAYYKLATERYKDYSQALQEYRLLESPAGQLAKAMITHYLHEVPRVTATQMDKIQAAVLGAALYIINKSKWEH